MLLRMCLRLFPLFLLPTLQLCLGSPLTTSKDLQPYKSSSISTDPSRADYLRGNRIGNRTETHAPRYRKRDDDYEAFDLVHVAAANPIQPYDAGAMIMSIFYHLLMDAATGRWRNRPQGQHLRIVWGRVAMLMLVQGVEFISWDMVADMAATMLQWIDNGHVAFTFEAYYVRRAEYAARHGLYVGVRILEEQEAVNAYLNAGRDGTLDLSNL
ncbi:MAG: hypothetical protein Q9186_004277 [Xanthomendoza sp. 1 TL-2023]